MVGDGHSIAKSKRTHKNQANKNFLKRLCQQKINISQMFIYLLSKFVSINH